DDFAGSDDEDDDGAFHPRQKLRPALVVKRNLQSLMDLLDTPWLELNPEYQRDVVWDQKRMVGLINSILEDYYIPPIIFNRQKVTLEDGTSRWKRVCVDGKQRLSSVRAFIQGKIPVKDRKGVSWYLALPSSAADIDKVKHRKVLSDKNREDFRNKEFVCYEFNDLAPDQEEDLFARVQKGVQLTPAEKLRATTGLWQDFARTFEEDFRTVINLTDTKRSSGFRLLLFCFAQIVECQKFSSDKSSRSTGKPLFRCSVPGLNQFINDTSAFTDATKSHLARVFNTFTELLVQDPQAFQGHAFARSKRFAPIEVVAVSALISRHSLRKTHVELLSDIRRMRTMIRGKFMDVMMNPPTWAQFWGFIED
ncbi:hypothetical protein NA57DRAFT_9566, partial [Rhizodiscina lignyota]